MALIFDPNTGAYVDNQSGKVYSDPNGVHLSTDPGLTSQAQRNLQVANELFARVGGDYNRYKQVFQQQAELARSLDRTIRGEGPSVAVETATQGAERARQAADSQASGATGVNQPLARYAAIQAAGDASAAANQAGILGHTQEVTEAQRTKAAILGQQASEANTSAGVNVAGMNASQASAVTPATKQADIDEQDRARWMNFITNTINAGGSAVGRAATA